MNAIPGDKNHSCNFCDKRFSRRYNLKRHVESRHGENLATNEDSDMNDAVQSDNSLSVDESSDIEVDEDESGEEESSEDESSSDLEDNIAFTNWLEEAKKITKDTK